MKKSVCYLIVLLALCGVGMSFASVGGATKKTGNRQGNFPICLNTISMDTMQASQCAAQ
jgi:hypothetical protein